MADWGRMKRGMQEGKRKMPGSVTAGHSDTLKREQHVYLP
jgi:hypothetical protein